MNKTTAALVLIKGGVRTEIMAVAQAEPGRGYLTVRALRLYTDKRPEQSERHEPFDTYKDAVERLEAGIIGLQLLGYDLLYHTEETGISVHPTVVIG